MRMDFERESTPDTNNLVVDTRPADHNTAAVVRRSAVRVGAVDDPAEADADRIGAVLMRAMSAAPEVHECDNACDHQTGTRIQRSAQPGARVDRSPSAHVCDDSCTHDGSRRVLRRASNVPAVHPSAGRDGGPLDAGTVNRIRRAGGGAPLDAQMLPQLEAATDQNLSGVRIHSNSALAPELGAQAFTFGESIHLAPGAPAPSSGAGRELLAHELGHVVQQGQGGVRRAAIVQRRLDHRIPFDVFKTVLDRSPKHRSVFNHRPSTGLGQFDVEYLHNGGPGQLIVTVKPYFEYCQEVVGGVATPGGWSDAEKQDFEAKFVAQTTAAWSGKYQFQCTKPGFDHLAASVVVRVTPVADVNQSHFHHRVQKTKQMITGIGREQNDGADRNIGNFAEQDAPERPHDSANTCAGIADHDRGRLEMLLAAHKVNPVRFKSDGSTELDDASKQRIDAFVAAAVRTERPGSVPIPMQAIGKRNKREGSKKAQGRAAALKAYIESKAFKNNQNCETILYDDQVADQEAVYKSKRSARAKEAEKETLDAMKSGQRHREAILAVKPDFKWAGDPYSILAHEFGHMLGNPDEYFTYGSAKARDAKVNQLMSTGKVEDAQKALDIQARNPSGKESHASPQEAMSDMALQQGVEIPEYGPTTSSIMSAGADVLPAHYLPLLEALSKITDAAITFQDWKIV